MTTLQMGIDQRAAQAAQPSRWQLAALTPSRRAVGNTDAAVTPKLLHLAALEGGPTAQRRRNSRWTPSGTFQPPEVLGVDASPSVGNPEQPMAGEFDQGGEVADGRPAFFPPWMPQPNGTANGVGVQAAAQAHVFGAPTGMPTGVPTHALAALPAMAQRSGPSPLAALPHFATGGALPAGGTGVVGEDGEEEIHANPAGGVSITPLAASAPAASLPDAHSTLALAALQPGVAALPRTAATNRTINSADLAALPKAPASAATNPLAALPPTPSGGYRRLSATGAPEAAPAPGSDTTPVVLDPFSGQPMPDRLGRETGGYGVTAPPPEDQTAEQQYLHGAQQVLGAKAPQPGDPAYKTPWWRKLTAVAAGAFAGGLARDPRLGAQVAQDWAPDKYQQAQQRFGQQQRQQLAALAPLKSAAQQEQQQNATDTRAWEQQQQAAGRRQNADNLADYRTDEQNQRDRANAQEQDWHNQTLALERQNDALRAKQHQTPADTYRAAVAARRTEGEAAGLTGDALQTYALTGSMAKQPGAAARLTPAQQARAKQAIIAGVETKRQQIYGTQPEREAAIQARADKGEISQPQAEEEKRALEQADDANYNAALDALDGQLAAVGLAPGGWRRAGTAVPQGRVPATVARNAVPTGWTPPAASMQPGKLYHYSDGSTWHLAGGKPARVQ